MVGLDNRMVGLQYYLVRYYYLQQVIVDVMPIATALAGFNMRLLPGAYRYVIPFYDLRSMFLLYLPTF